MSGLFELAGLRRALLHEQRLIILQLLLRALEGRLLVDALEGAGAHVLVGQLLCLHGDGFQTRTAVEGVLADVRHRLGQGELRQGLGALEGVIADLLQLVHGREGLQHLTAAEGAILDGYHVGATLHRLQLRAVGKGVLADGLDVLANLDRCQFLVALEGVVRDRGHLHRLPVHGNRGRDSYFPL